MKENFRDLSNHIKSIKRNFIFRSSVYWIINNIDQLESTGIGTVIDLRCTEEIAIMNYQYQLMDRIKYCSIPLELEKGKLAYSDCTEMESAYRYLATSCRNEIARIFRVIFFAEKPVLIHCIHGMDRTGIVAALLALLCNSPLDEIYDDYLETGPPTLSSHLRIFLDEVKQHNSISDFLATPPLYHEQISQLRKKISNDENSIFFKYK